MNLGLSQQLLSWLDGCICLKPLVSSGEAAPHQAFHFKYIWGLWDLTISYLRSIIWEFHWCYSYNEAWLLSDGAQVNSQELSNTFFFLFLPFFILSIGSHSTSNRRSIVFKWLPSEIWISSSCIYPALVPRRDRWFNLWTTGCCSYRDHRNDLVLNCLWLNCFLFFSLLFFFFFFYKWTVATWLHPHVTFLVNLTIVQRFLFFFSFFPPILSACIY